MRLLSTTAIFLGAALLLSGCQSAPQPSPSVIPTSTSASVAPRPTPTAKPMVAPVFAPGGSAEQNLAFFTYVIEQAIAADPKVSSADVASLEEQNGFAKGTIEYTFTRTAAGLAADSAAVAALVSGECIVAQYGPVITGVHSVVLPALATGGCLIGSQVQHL